MIRDNFLEELKVKFSKDIIDIFDKSISRVYIEINPGALVAVSKFLFDELKARFNIASGIDVRNNFEILYHFTIDELNLLLSLRVKLDKKKPRLILLQHSLEGANWVEREMFEMLGIKFTGHPELKRLLLPDDWPQNVHPLKQDYREWDKTAVRDRGV